MKASRILITSGEPAGIGPDIVVKIAQDTWPTELVVVGDPDLLTERAASLGLPLELKPFDENSPAEKNPAGVLKVIPVALRVPCLPGRIDRGNAAYVMEMLKIAASFGMKSHYPVVTAPVQKSILMEGGYDFQGHTEFFAECANVSTVMLFVVKQNGVKVALATTHLPLAEVANAITTESLLHTLRTLNNALTSSFGIMNPIILVCGLNPHAGESGHLGREEIEIISPTLELLKNEGMQLLGPLPADTIFTEKYLRQADAVLAMYHDQALPVVKYMSFGSAVNVTAGLPFIRTSVDHGTALDVAGTGKADASSLKEAINMAIDLHKRRITS